MMRRFSTLVRTFSSNVGSQGAKSTAAPPKPDPLKNVTGLTAKCVANNEARQVPGTNKEYLVPEYFGYNRMSYAEADVEMESYRIPQPVAPRK